MNPDILENNMKKLLEVIPFILLIVLVPFFYYNEPNLSQSLIITAISALCGYRFYCMEQVKPDYVEIFKDEFDKYKLQRDTELDVIVKRHEKAMLHIEAKVKELDGNYGKMSMEKTRKATPTNFQF